MEDKLRKHLDFCKKYPQTIVGYEQGINVFVLMTHILCYKYVK
jgi:hypothetical protein